MTKLADVCLAIRTKNAGPFWITADLFFDGPEAFRRYARCEQLGAEVFAQLYGVEASLVKHFPVERLHMLKVSYPRAAPQGGMIERDMHGGQQFVRLLDIEL
jgi:hypothetical protein